MFASDVTKEVTLPSDPSVSVTIAKLGWLQKEAAQKESQRQAARALVDMGGAVFMKEMQAMAVSASDNTATAAPPTDDPYLSHDPLLVLVGGVKRWSNDRPITKDTLAQLDQDDAEFLAREILGLTIRKRTEEQEKNGVSGSIGI